MIILHTSDWHLGKIFFGKKLTEEQAIFFEKNFFPLLKDIKPDLIIVTGDIIDRPNPDYETQRLFCEILLKLFKEKIPCIFILGNHDSKRITLFKEFLKYNNLIIIDDLSYFTNPIPWENEKGEKIYLYPLPYLSFYEFKENLENLCKKTFFQKNQFTLKDLVEILINLKENFLLKPAILLGHFAIEEGIFCGEEFPLTIIGNEEIFPLILFENFDVLLLGHLHRIQKIKEKVFYAGSILPYSFEEAKFKKGMWLLEIKNGILIKDENIFLDPPMKLKTIKGYFKDLIKSPPDNAYLKVILQDKEPVLHPFERLKSIFPNLLALEYEEKHPSFYFKDFSMEEISSNSKIEINEEKLFKDFYKYVEEKEIEEKLFHIFKKYLKEFKEENMEKEV